MKASFITPLAILAGALLVEGSAASKGSSCSTCAPQVVASSKSPHQALRNALRKASRHLETFDNEDSVNRVESARNHGLGHSHTSGKREAGASTSDVATPASFLSFAGPMAKLYEVGNEIPGVGFKTPISWAGLIPVSPTADISVKGLQNISAADDVRSTFFWLWGAETQEGADDLVVWFNGGPGCSSLSGFWTENGPINWTSTLRPPKPNPDSWTKQASVIWVEHPIPTGFSRGKKNLLNEEQASAEFYHFWTNLLKVFPELRGKRLWFAGESYAGFYLTFIADHFYKAKDSYNLQGQLFIDVLISEFEIQSSVARLNYAKRFNDTLHIADPYFQQLENAAKDCKYSTYVEDNYHFPPKGHLPLPPGDVTCDVDDAFYAGIQASNPNFNVYDVRFKGPGKPFATSSLGNPNKATSKTFMNHPDLKKYIHAPVRDWLVCSEVFPREDGSEAPDKGALQRVIEKNKRTIFAHGVYDGLLLVNGTLLAVNNLTWHGEQGFPQSPSLSFKDRHGQEAGKYTEARGVAFVEEWRAGHMIPGDDPPGGYALLSALLGRTTLGGAKLDAEK